MKIIKVSNFNNEDVSDQLIAENVFIYYADFIMMALNGKYSGARSPFYFKSVDDDYKLYTFKP